MAAISDLDRGAFESVTKGVHDFNEGELQYHHEVAMEVKDIVRVANYRQQKAINRP